MLVIQRCHYFLNSGLRVCYLIVLTADLPNVGCKLSDTIELSELTLRTHYRFLFERVHDRFMIVVHREWSTFHRVPKLSSRSVNHEQLPVVGAIFTLRRRQRLREKC